MTRKIMRFGNIGFERDGSANAGPFSCVGHLLAPTGISIPIACKTTQRRQDDPAEDN